MTLGSESVFIRGQRELEQALARIPREMEPKILQKALAAGARLVVEQAKRNAVAGGQFPSRDTGTLQRAIYQGRGKKSTPDNIIRIINVRRGNRAAERKGGSADAYYARMVEYGHRLAKPGKRLLRETTATTKKGFDRYQRRLVAPTYDRKRLKGMRTWGKVEAFPFMRPAWDAMKDKAMTVSIYSIEAAVNKAVEKSRF